MESHAKKKLAIALSTSLLLTGLSMNASAQIVGFDSTPSTGSDVVIPNGQTPTADTPSFADSFKQDVGQLTNDLSSLGSTVKDVPIIKDLAQGYEGISQSVGEISGAYDQISNAISNPSQAIEGIGGAIGQGGVGDLGGMSGMMGGSSNPVSSMGGITGASGLAGTYTDTGSIVTGYCNTTMPIATSAGMVAGFNQLDKSIGSQISNATNILNSTIQDMIAKASQANTEQLESQKAQDKKLAETRMNYDEAQDKALDLAKKKAEIAEEMDINKLNNTNGCSISDTAQKKLLGDSAAKKLSGNMAQSSRNFNRSVKTDATGLRGVYKTLLENDKALDSVVAQTQILPRTLTPEQLKEELEANKLMANPNPAPDIDNEKVKNSINGKDYLVAKRILDKKVEAIQAVFNHKTSQAAPTTPAPEDDKKLMEFLSEEFDSGLKDKEQKPIMVSKIVENEKGEKMTSPEALLEAQVKYFTSNPEYWKSVVTKLSLSSKLEETLKMQSLQVDLLHKIYQQQLVSNSLKAFAMQEETSEQSKDLGSQIGSTQAY